MANKPNDTNDIKTAMWPYLKYFSLLATIMITPIIISMPGFEYWHLTPIWGGGGLTTIIVWQRTHKSTISPEMEAALRQESMRLRHDLYRQLIILFLVVIFIGGILVLPLLAVKPELLDKIFEFILELIKE